MQLLFAERHELFLQFLEMLFHRLNIQRGCPILPVTVNARADYVYNALPSWTHACIVDMGKGGSTLTTERAFSPTHYKNREVTKVRVQPPTFDDGENSADVTKVATPAEFDAAMASWCSGKHSPSSSKKTNAYFMMRAALVAVSTVRRQNALDVVVVPSLGPVTPETALSMYAATSEFFKLQ